ncbi:hypothetical protein [uncultured Thiodictyon sp.]|uniref:glycosyltransferase n=1 Tax=uncultured Thiodictyon sp. TaxID=1846217 RepID=UPI0025E3EA36|nr:hypothetical protein [uncultured Thiodictyon sp.]
MDVEQHLKRPDRIRIGFGPLSSLAEDESTVGVRKYRIDPIVDYINQSSSRYTAGFFWGADDIGNFDLIVLVKLFDVFEYSQIRSLKRQGKKIIYDIVDNPCNYRPTRVYHDSPEFMGMMDFIIASSPLHIKDMENIDVPITLIPHPVINLATSAPLQQTRSRIRLVWQGYSHNIGDMFSIHPILKRVAAETGRNIQVIYHTNARFSRGDCYEIWPWHICDWKQVLSSMDIGIVIKNRSDFYQARKPSNKVLSYMAAGLPVICHPSPSDELVVQDGFNGFKITQDEDWFTYLTDLIGDDKKREVISANAKQFALENFSIEKIGAQYETIFDRVFLGAS